nr:Wzz/FepE/Etk N-terminal domain-containing protein [Bacillus sp. Marseille-P3661]
MEEISLKEIFQTLKKRLWLIISLACIAAIASAIISFFVLTPIYQSSTQILVNQAKSEQAIYNVNDIRTNIELINTYNVIIKSPVILDKVIEELELNRSYGQLNSQITVGSENNSQVVAITVQDPDPVMAAKIANTTATVFQRDIVNIMNVDNVSILAQADEGGNPSPIKPRPTLNIAIAIVVGLMAGVGLAFLLEYLDNTIKSEQDVERILDLPVLGTVTVIDVEKELKVRDQQIASAKIGSEHVGS